MKLVWASIVKLVWGKSGVLFLAIGVGLLVPQGHQYAYLIKYSLMAMLFLSWIDAGVSPKALLQPRLWGLVGTMVGVAIATFGLFTLIDPQLGMIAALLAITPTALAAPVVTGLLNGRVEFVTASVLITNSLIALILPIILPALPGQTSAISGGGILINTLTVVALPLAAAQLLRYGSPEVATRLKQAQPVTFYLWLMGLYLASAKASYFVRQTASDWRMLMAIALVALVLCTLNFGLGRWLGRPGLVQESGQALGQKNTMFAVWVCLTFLTPTMALGPMFYIVFQNIYNAYLLSQSAQR